MKTAAGANIDEHGAASARRMPPVSRRRARNAFVHSLLVAALLVGAGIMLLPFAWILCGAFKTTADFFDGAFLPRGEGLFGVAWDRLTLDNFSRAGSLGIGRALLNSVFLSATTAVVSTVGAAMGAYALAKYRFPGRSFAFGLVLLALVIPGTLLLAPGYQVMYDLRLLGTYGALLFPALAPAFGVFLFRQAMLHSVPDEILESARIDGASEARIFVEIVLPLVRPMTGAFLLITFLGTWNNFILPQVMFQSPDMFPLSVAVNQLRGSYTQDYGLIMAGTLISIAPLICLFLMLQRDFLQGLTAGALKG
jgi:multiple sugar transport system permease protein